MGVKSTLAAMTLKAKVVIVCAAVAVTGGTAAGIGIAMSREEAYRVLKVFELTGSAIVERDGSGELDAYTGMNLESGDMLTVGEESTIRISLDDDKYILLDSGTVLELTATGTAADSRTAVDLKQGTILNEITNPLSANSSYEVATPKSTMAVRGTSFEVSVEEDENGIYTISENTFQGKVEIELIGNNGKPTGKKALATAGKGVKICTEPNENSGNPAEIDGTSRFIFPNGESEDPVFDINYDNISSVIKNMALRSNDENIMPLNEDILNKLRGLATQTETSVTTTVTTTQTTTTTVTTVPETTKTEEETTVTAAPVTTVPTQTETSATVPETKPQTTAKTTAPTTKKTAKKTKKTTSETTVTTEETTETAETTVTTTETTAETTTETTTTTPNIPSYVPKGDTGVTGPTYYLPPKPEEIPPEPDLYESPGAYSS